MTGDTFKEANTTFGRPKTFMEAISCDPIMAHRGSIQSGSLEGADIVVTCWRPNPDEVSKILNGAPVYIGFVGRALPPHVVATSFREVVNPR